MRVTIAGVFFYLQASEVEQKMSTVEPEPIDGDSVVVGTTAYPVKQVGRIVTGQDPGTSARVRSSGRCGSSASPASPARRLRSQHPSSDRTGTLARPGHAPLSGPDGGARTRAPATASRAVSRSPRPAPRSRR